MRPSISARSCDRVSISMQSTTIPRAVCRQTCLSRRHENPTCQITG
jgi:hypothetical protein